MTCLHGLTMALMLAGCGGIAVIDGDDTKSSQKSSGGGGAVDISLLNALGHANCQPVPSGDPLDLSFTLRFDNSGTGPASISVIAARLTAAVGTMHFEVNPTIVDPIVGGSSQDVTFDKLPGTGVGTPGCMFCTSTDTRLQLDLQIDAKAVAAAVDETIDSVSCVF